MDIKNRIKGEVYFVIDSVVDWVGLLSVVRLILQGRKDWLT